MPAPPIQCVVEYHPELLSPEESAALFVDLCENHNVSNRKVLMEDGTEIEVETGSYLFTDEHLTGYDAFPKVWGDRQSWSPLMKMLKDRVESVSKRQFQVCRIVYYENGEAGMEFHSDPSAYGDNTWIASVSLGEEREFLLRNKEDHNEVHSYILGTGSLIIMGEHCQDRYEHAIPRDPKYRNPRINLTFRRYGFDSD
jgi:alkylated DNA repair dioxygenase AlkB